METRTRFQVVSDSSLKMGIQKLIDTGELNLGEPCAPYILTKSSVNEEGQVVTDTTEVHAQKWGVN